MRAAQHPAGPPEWPCGRRATPGRATEQPSRWRTGGPPVEDATAGLAGDLEALGIRFVPFTAEDAGLVEEVRRTARRQRLRLSLADCCCLAVGIRLNLPVIGGDQAWEALRLGVDVHPLR